jgi:predicted RNA-binding protein YlqC (UPF0109 family)
MRELLDFILKEITGKSDYEISEQTEGQHTNFVILAPSEYIGLLIGKGGRTIKSIRNLLKVRATLEKVSAQVSVEEKTS